MAVLLELLVETLILLTFLWIGKSIMKAQVPFKALITTSLAGAFASQVPFVGMYLSFLVVLFFLWKMARVDMVPDGALILIIGKGAGFIAMIYAVGFIHEHVDPQELTSLDQIPVYEDDEGTSYYAEEEKIYYLDEEGEKVFVDANVIFGISDVMQLADAETESSTTESVEEASVASLEVSEEIIPETPEVARDDIPSAFSNPFLSDTVVRGEPTPYKMYVPQGWMIQKSEGTLAIHLDGHTYVNCYSSNAISDNKTYLRGEVNRVMSQYSGYEVARQEVVTLHKKQWAKIQFANKAGDQVLLMTHGSNLGCYSVELNGSFNQLSSQKAALNKIMASFKFPPSTYFLAQLEPTE